MALSPEAAKVLAQIITLGTSDDLSEQEDACFSPGYDHLCLLSGLLANEPREEELQQFLAKHPHFLLGLLGSNDAGDLAYLIKPHVGTKHKADFGLLMTSQAGARLTLVEIEPSVANLFTRNGTPAKRLQTALGQILDWQQWISEHRSSYIRDIIDLAKSLPEYNKEHVLSEPGRGYRFTTPEDIEELWRIFGSYEDPRIRYIIVIGRWSSLSKEHQKRLLSFNREHSASQIVYTYEQVGRQANSRPLILDGG